MIDPILITYMQEMLRQTPTSFHRYLYDQIPWKSRMVGVVGPRGVGKSTLFLQHVKENNINDALYVSADNTYFASHRLVDLADDFVKEGGKRLYIDEIHKYKGWSAELKQIYDVHPSLKIYFTGSSVLDIHKGNADLSRRALVYKMQGLSFREYLELFEGIKANVYSFEQIVENKVSLPEIEHPLPSFRKYLKEGYYPFAIEGGLAIRISQIVNQTLEVDIPGYADMKASTVRKLRRMLAVISSLAPYKPSMESLAVELGVSKNNVPDYLIYLEMAGMIGMLRDDTVGIRALGKLEKVYLDNPTLQYSIAGENANIGSVRETFFYNQMRVNNDVLASKISDFRIGDFVFEVGGKGKGFSQLKGAKRGIVVKDDIEHGYADIIPLWHFGFNY